VRDSFIDWLDRIIPQIIGGIALGMALGSSCQNYDQERRLKGIERLVDIPAEQQESEVQR
jgi:hypothetical protein